MNYNYTIRVTIEDLTNEQVSSVRELISGLDSYLVTKEGGDAECKKDHYHVVCSTTKKIDALRQIIKRKCPFLAGNAMFSIKAVGPTEADRENILRYVCKGVSKTVLPEVVMQQGFIDPAEYHRKYWDVNAELKSFRKKTTSKDWFEAVLVEIREKGLEWDRRGETKNTKAIFDIVVQKCPGVTDFQITVYMLKLKRILAYDQWSEGLWERCSDKWC